MKPLILLTAEEVFDEVTHRHYYMTKRSYSLAVSGAGGAPLMDIEPKYAADYAGLCDGLLLTDGRAEINPARYGEPVIERFSDAGWYGHGFEYGRDSLEIFVAKAFMDAGKPVFGIGRGMQIINIVLGGTLWQNVNWDAGKTHLAGCTHHVRTRADTKLGDLLGNGFTVNSYHSQAIKTLGRELCACAWADDGVIEAIEHETLPVFGVQWNPETWGTTDEIEFERNRLQTGSVTVDHEKADEYWENQLKMVPTKGVTTDADIPVPTGNRLFDYFVTLCKGDR